ncbi:hypothetical protein SCLCIDRAFT_1206873 [Scleroderma citrinum Foug A]|uniref:Uncharacterized protein n=1 Tax=Scleroderma citrinum Foug A TaxID=1036808 RepID=A0A0C3B0D6_9AGAM|nr:hypothetical protein SCLCIDRAFT_1206873 [Scleroderma citrinum Foug A]
MGSEVACSLPDGPLVPPFDLRRRRQFRTQPRHSSDMVQRWRDNQLFNHLTRFLFNYVTSFNLAALPNMH